MYIDIWVLISVALLVGYHIYKTSKDDWIQIEQLKKPIFIWEELSKDTDFKLEGVRLSLNEQVHVKIFKNVETQQDIPEFYKHLKISVHLTRGKAMILLHNDLLGIENMKGRKIESVEDLKKLEIDAILHASELIRKRINTGSR